MFRFIVLLLFPFIGFSQSNYVGNLGTKNPISFVTISQGDSIYYSTIEGKFSIKNPTSEPITFSILGYEEKTILYSQLTDSVFLKPTSSLLEEIVINSEDKIEKEYFHIKTGSKRRDLSSIFIRNNEELGSEIYPVDPDFTSILSSVTLYPRRLDKYNDPINSYSYIRFYIYSMEDGKKGQMLYSSNAILVDINRSYPLDLDVENHKIVLDKRGLCLTIVYIGDFIGDQKKQDGNEYLRFQTSSSKYKELDSRTYILNNSGYQNYFESFGELSKYSLRIDFKFLHIK